MGGIISFLFPDPKRIRVGKVVPRVDYDAEGQRLMNSVTSGFDRVLHRALNTVLGEIPSKDGQYHDVDVIWTHPESGGLLYVGNDRAARNDEFLQSIDVTSIVNCTRPSKYGQLPDHHKHTGRYRYYDFPAGHWYENCIESPQGHPIAADADKFDACLRFVIPVAIFCLRSLKRGECVLVHCLAGAHRAGTTGIMLLMFLQGLKSSEAINLAQRLRPVIQPISDFPHFLALFERALRWKLKGGLQACWKTVPAVFTGIGGKGIGSSIASNGSQSASTSKPPLVRAYSSSAVVGLGIDANYRAMDTLTTSTSDSADTRIADSLQRRGSRSQMGGGRTPRGSLDCTPTPRGRGSFSGKYGIAAEIAEADTRLKIRRPSQAGSSSSELISAAAAAALVEATFREKSHRRRSYAESPYSTIQAKASDRDVEGEVDEAAVLGVS